ncbi:MAG: YciI family protein [Candidatus Acidiferrales bacterium]
MQYLALIYETEGSRSKMSPEQEGAMQAEYGKLITELGPKFIGGNRLRPASSATTIRVREGKRLVTDGPFAETKEYLGGYFLIEAADLDEAIAIASRIPAARMDCVEVRPVVPREQAAAR